MLSGATALESAAKGATSPFYKCVEQPIPSVFPGKLDFGCPPMVRVPVQVWSVDICIRNVSSSLLED